MLVRDARLDGRPTALVDGTPPRVLDLAHRPLDARARRRRAARRVGRHRVDDAAALRILGLSAVTLTVPRTGVDLTVNGGFVAEQTETGRPTAAGSCTDRRAGRSRSRGSARPTIGARRCRCARARASPSSSRSAKIRRQSPPACASRSSQGLAREIVLSTPDGVIVNQVAGATVADWTHAEATLTVSFLEPIATATSLVVIGARCARRATERSPFRSSAMPAAERETGGVAVDVIGAGEIAERQPRGLEPADRQRSRRHRRRAASRRRWWRSDSRR